jgi:ATP-binding cassette subfamily F protein uup
MSTSSTSGNTSAPKTAADERLLKKDLQRIERSIAKIDEKISELHGKMAAAATDFGLVAQLDQELKALKAEQSTLEEQWLATSSQLD